MIAVLIDANILISFLLSNQPERSVSQVVATIRRPDVRLIVPQEVLDEVRDVCARKPYLRRRIQQREVDRLLDILPAVGHKPHQPPPAHTTSRDPKDDYLLVYALLEEIDYLVTGDEDLLVLGRVGDVQIVSPVTFLRRVDSTS